MNDLKMEALKRIRAKKDDRMKGYKENSEQGFLDMLDDREEYSDMAEAGMTMEEKEDKAKQILEMKRRELEIME